MDESDNMDSVDSILSETPGVAPRNSRKRAKRSAYILEEKVKNESNLQTEQDVAPGNKLSAPDLSVGGLLARIPGILEVHSSSYAAIENTLSSIGTSIANAIGTSLAGAFNSVGDKIDNSLNTNFDKLESKLDTIGSKMDKLDKLDKFDTLGSTMDENFVKLTDTLGSDTDKMEEAVHDGFDMLSSIISSGDTLESALHEGFHDLTHELESHTEMETILDEGLNGIKDVLEDSENPVINLQSFFRSLSKYKCFDMSVF